MGDWNKKIVNIGDVKVGKSVKVEFKYLDSEPKVVKVTANCGCLSPKYDEVTQVVKVTYTAPKFSHHIISDTQSIKKSIAVFYSDGKSEQLIIMGTKIR